MRRNQHSLLIVLALAVGSSAPGCAPFRSWCGQRFAPAAVPAPCALPDDATQAEVITYLNDNTKKLLAWRTTKATIVTRGGGILVPRVGAMIAVEAPPKFRLVATNPLGGNEGDLRSNQKHFSFWNPRSEEKALYQAHGQ